MSRFRWRDRIIGIIFVYVGFGVAWAITTEFFHHQQFPSPDVASRSILPIELASWVLFILASAAMLFALMRRSGRGREELEANERFLSNIFTSIQDGISVLDTGLRIVRVNATMERWYPHAMPLVGKRCYEAYHGRSHPCEVCPTQRTLATGERAYEIVPMTGPQGKVRGWLDLFSFPLRDPETGEMTAVIEYVRDITARRRAEEALRESERRFRDIAECSLDWIWEVDAEGRYTYASPVVERVLGYSPEDVRGKFFYDFFHPDDRDRLKAEAFSVIGQKRPFRNFVNRNVRRDGKVVWLQTSGTPVLDTAGALVGYRGADTDITESVAVSERLRSHSDDLERMVAERTRELDHVRGDLFAQAKLAAMGRLGAGIAHQLYSPLGGGLLLIDSLVAECQGSPKQLRMLSEARRALDQMRRIIEAMLSMAGVRRRGRPHRIHLDVNELLDGILGILLLECAKRGIAIEKSFAVGIPQIQAHVGEIDQIFLNLLNNAIDAMEGGGTLTVQTTIRGDGVEVSIADTGKGIPPDHLDRIFEPFFTTQKGKRGLGLGLAIAREAVDRYGGRISVESEEGRGAEFTVWLPFAGVAEGSAGGAKRG